MPKKTDDDRRASAVSRRALLRRTAVSAGGALALSALPKKSTAQDKMPQGEVAYQDSPKGDQRCDNCALFVAPNGCQVVEGEISPQGWCNVWAPLA